MPRVEDIEIARDAYVEAGSSVLDAAATLAEAGVSAIAVLDTERRVIGLLTVERVIAALFPPYLRDLRHTAGVGATAAAVAQRAGEAEGEPVEQHMIAPDTLDVGDSTLHAAERFLHCEADALPVVSEGRFVGMLDDVVFSRALLALARGDDSEGAEGG